MSKRQYNYTEMEAHATCDVGDKVMYKNSVIILLLLRFIDWDKMI